MSTRIRISRLKAQIDKEAIAAVYEFFYLETCEKYIKRGAYILDAVSMDRSVKAVKFESGKKMLVMLERNVNNVQKLKSTLHEIEEGSKYSIMQVSFKEIEDPVLVQLLLNALGSLDSDFLRFNNLTGHLYCYHEAWIKHGKEKTADVIWKVPALEISVDKNMCLHLDVRTFISEKLKNKVSFGKKKFEDYPKYVFSAKKTLRRKLNSDTDTCFIMRQADGVRSEIPFLDLQSEEGFVKTKMGILQDIVHRFNSKYKGLVVLDFETKEIVNRVDYSKHAAKEKQTRIREELLKTGICIVDQIGDEYSKQFCVNIQELLRSKYDVAAIISKQVKKDRLNICLIHNAAYYDGVNDPHDKIYDGVAVQHITFEDFADSSEFALGTVVHELLIKKDLNDGKISLFDWSALGYEQDVLFGMETEKDGINRYFFICIKPDGSFIIQEQENTLLEMNEYSAYVDIFEEAKTRGENIKGIIKTEDGMINVIKDSGMFTLPEIDEIQVLLSEGDNKLRGKERREELLLSCLDIKLYEEGGSQYYFVGTIGEGMRWNIQRASVVRKIEGYNGAPVMFEELLLLMNVSFVRNGQLTVVPFPFKYLREYLQMRM